MTGKPREVAPGPKPGGVTDVTPAPKKPPKKPKIEKED